MKREICKHIDYIKPAFVVVTFAGHSSVICQMSPGEDDLKGEGEDFEFDN